MTAESTTANPAPPEAPNSAATETPVATEPSIAAPVAEVDAAPAEPEAIDHPETPGESSPAPTPVAPSADETPLTGAAAEEALEQLDASLAQAAETLAEEPPPTANADPPTGAEPAIPVPEATVPEAVLPSASPSSDPPATATSDPKPAEPAQSDADAVPPAEFETASDVVAEVAASEVAVPKEVVEAAAAAAPAAAVAAVAPTEGSSPTRKAVEPSAAPSVKDAAPKPQAKAKAETVQWLRDRAASFALRLGVAVLGVIALPLRLVGDGVRSMIGMFAGATLATAGMVWGMVLFVPTPKATSPVEKLLAIAEKEREAEHGAAAGGHGAASGGHGETKAKSDGHAAKPEKKKADHGGGGHEAKPKKKEAAHAPAKKADKKKDAGHGGGGH